MEIGDLKVGDEVELKYYGKVTVDKVLSDTICFKRGKAIMILNKSTLKLAEDGTVSPGKERYVAEF